MRRGADHRGQLRVDQRLVERLGGGAHARVDVGDLQQSSSSSRAVRLRESDLRRFDARLTPTAGGVTPEASRVTRRICRAVP